MPYSSRFDRALGALLGGALGDAMGMPTQLLSATAIREAMGYVDGLRAASSDHPVARGLPAGTITDDTEQTLLLGRILLESGPVFDHKRWVNALIDWERGIKARGSCDLLGPSTKRAIEAIHNGVPVEEAGRTGDTNGAAMRIAPVGIAVPPQPLTALVAKVAETCRATHNTQRAIAAAAAAAAAISAGIDGADWRAAAVLAIEAARLGAREGVITPGPDIAARIEWAMTIVEGKNQPEAMSLIIDRIGTGVAAQESVPAAFAVLATAGGDAWKAAVISANLGGDTDTIGALAGGIAGACSGYAALARAPVDRLRGVTLTELETLARHLLSIRREGQAP